MEGTRIDLKERRLEKLRRRNGPEEERIYTKSSYYHSYTFRFDKPYKKFAREKSDQVLKITTLELPPDVRTFNTGASLERWSKKSARLKSSKKQREAAYHYDEEDEGEEQDVDVEEMYFENAYHVEEDTGEENNNETEIDADVQKLIIDSANYEEDEEECPKKSKHRASALKDKQQKRKRKKKLTFTLSRPASPETVQVIRVDVTSNYSVEEDADTDADNYCERFQDILDDDEGTDEKDCNDFTVMCKKLTLSARE